MANEITVDFGLRASRSGVKTEVPNTQYQFDTGSSLFVDGSQSIGTTHEILELSGLSNGGVTRLFNADSTHTVQIGVEVSATFYPLFEIPPQKPAFLPKLSTLNVYAKSTGAAAVNLVRQVFQQ